LSLNDCGATVRAGRRFSIDGKYEQSYRPPGLHAGKGLPMIVEPKRPLALFLVGLNAELAARRFRMDRPLWIGKAVSADVFVPELTLRRCHCRIERTAVGPILVDFSGAGVLVNGQRVRRQPLQPGDTLRLGRFDFRVVLDTQPVPTNEQNGFLRRTAV
jgi:hypothetical protein